MKPKPLSVRQKAFLSAYSVTGIISKAAKAADVARQKHYEWLRNPDYATAFDTARDEAIEVLEATVRESATVGIEEPVIYQGQLCFEPLRNADGSYKRTAGGEIRYSKKPLTIRKRNDVAAFFLLKALKPDVYREHSTVEHTGSVEIVERLAAGRARVAKARQALIETS